MQIQSGFIVFSNQTLISFAALRYSIIDTTQRLEKTIVPLALHFARNLITIINPGLFMLDMYH